MYKYNRKQFFDGFRVFLRKSNRNLTQARVNALEFLLNKFEQDPKWKDVRHIAYALSTIAHETAWTFEPIKEYRAKAGTAGRVNQDRYWLSGYYGRGYVQLTWEANYRTLGNKLNINLVRNPDLALDRDIAFDIMTLGMFEGLYTGKKLSDYINSSKTDYTNARRIINALDKAALLATYAKEFEKILTDSSKVVAPEVLLPAAPIIEDVEIPIVEEDDPEVTVIEGSEPYNDIGFIATIKKDLAVVGGGNIGIETVQHLQIIPEWLIPMVSKIAVIVLLASGAYLTFRIVHYVVDRWQRNERKKAEALINSAPERKDIYWI